MPELVQLGVSINTELPRKFDKLMKSRRYTDHSETIRELVRERMVKHECDKDGKTIGAVTIGNHIFLQHKYLRYILSSMHVRIYENNCLEHGAITFQYFYSPAIECSFISLRLPCKYIIKFAVETFKHWIHYRCQKVHTCFGSATGHLGFNFVSISASMLRLRCYDNVR